MFMELGNERMAATAEEGLPRDYESLFDMQALSIVLRSELGY